MPVPTAHRRLESLERLPAAAFTCDGAGLITDYNRKAVELWGREPLLNDPGDRYGGAVKLFRADGSPLPQEQCCMALAVIEERELLNEELIIERSDGSRVCALANASPLRDAAGAPVGAIGVFVDITERKRGELTLAAHQEQLRCADRHKDEFMATLAHELRNPLAPLVHGLELLRSGKPDDPRNVAAVHTMMERQLTQMGRLVDDLLDISRIRTGQLNLRTEPVELATVVQLAVDTARWGIEEGGHELHVGLPREPLALQADPVRLAQVLANLLNNSARYTSRGGRISLLAEREGGFAVIRVRDTGIGIAPAMLTDIFGLFTQAAHDGRRHGGLGIGLHLARRLVHLHGGTLTAHSDGVGAGSEFVARLPLDRGEAAGAPAVA